jgi:hypothetical protein
MGAYNLFITAFFTSLLAYSFFVTQFFSLFLPWGAAVLISHIVCSITGYITGANFDRIVNFILGEKYEKY